MRSAATSARMVFASFEYTTAPPLKYSLAPPCAVSTAARSPPVHDSAAATVSLRRRSRVWSASMRSSSSGRVGGRLFGTEHESDARQHGQRGRGHQDSVCGSAEEHEQGQERVAARDETDHGYDEKGSRGGERVGDCHCATKTRSTTSPCLPSPAISWPL